MPLPEKPGPVVLKTPEAPKEPLPALTIRERKILKLLRFRHETNQLITSKLGKDLSTSEALTIYSVAQELGISEEKFMLLKELAKKNPDEPLKKPEVKK